MKKVTDLRIELQSVLERLKTPLFNKLSHDISAEVEIKASLLMQRWCQLPVRRWYSEIAETLCDRASGTVPGSLQDPAIRLIVIQEDFLTTVLSITHQGLGQSITRLYRNANSLTIRTKETNQVSNYANEYPEPNNSGVNKVYNLIDASPAKVPISHPQYPTPSISAFNHEYPSPDREDKQPTSPASPRNRLSWPSTRLGCGNTNFLQKCNQTWSRTEALDSTSTRSVELTELPLPFTSAWFEGFAYKGLYLRCFTGVHAAQIKEQVQTVSQIWRSGGQNSQSFSTFQPAVMFHVYPALQLTVDLGGCTLYATALVINEDSKGLDSITKTMFTDPSVLPGWSTILQPAVPSTGFLQITKIGGQSPFKPQQQLVGLSLLYSVSARHHEIDVGQELCYKFHRPDQGLTECVTLEDACAAMSALIGGASLNLGIKIPPQIVRPIESNILVESGRNLVIPKSKLVMIKKLPSKERSLQNVLYSS